MARVAWTNGSLNALLRGSSSAARVDADASQTIATAASLRRASVMRRFGSIRPAGATAATLVGIGVSEAAQRDEVVALGVAGGIPCVGLPDMTAVIRRRAR